MIPVVDQFNQTLTQFVQRCPPVINTDEKIFVTDFEGER